MNRPFFIKNNLFIASPIEICSHIYDVGHPLKLGRKTMEAFLNKFEIKFDKTYKSLYNQEYRQDKYFIGQKK